MPTLERKALLAALQSGGLYNQPIRKDHPLWIQALQDYKKDTGDQEVNLECGGCVNKIKRWMEK